MPADNSLEKLNKILNPKDGDLTHLFSLAALELEMTIVDMFAEDKISIPKDDMASVISSLSPCFTFAHECLAPLAQEGGFTEAGLLGLKLKLEMKGSVTTLNSLLSGEDDDRSTMAFNVMAVKAMARAAKHKIAL
jgi:hypothetical protein